MGFSRRMYRHAFRDCSFHLFQLCEFVNPKPKVEHYEINEFDAVRYGTYEDFLHFYSGDINTMDKYVNLNLLSLTLVNDKNELEKLK